MPRAAPILLASLWLVSLSACAPVMLGRTPTPAAPGVTELSVSAGYPIGLTSLPPDTGSFGPGPAYWPLPPPLGFSVAYGRSETLETNVALMVAPGLAGSVATGAPTNSAINVGARYGVKNRFQEGPVELAFDAGGSLYLTNVGVDAGILAAAPLGGAKLYGGLRGFGVFPVSGGFGGLSGAAALTVGGELPTGDGSSVLLELTLLTNLYNGEDYRVPDPSNAASPTPQPVGFSLVPAVGFTF